MFETILEEYHHKIFPILNLKNDILNSTELNETRKKIAQEAALKLYRILSNSGHEVQTQADVIAAVVSLKSKAALISLDANQAVVMADIENKINELNSLNSVEDRSKLENMIKSLDTIYQLLNPLFGVWRNPKQKPADAPYEELKEQRSAIFDLHAHLKSIHVQNEINFPFDLNQIQIDINPFKPFIKSAEDYQRESMIYLTAYNELNQALDHLLPQPIESKENNSTNSWKDTLLGTHQSNELNHAKYEANQYFSEAIRKNERFQSKKLASNAAGFCGTTYTSIEKPNSAVVGSSSDAIATDETGFSITDGVGYSPNEDRYNRIKQVASTISINLVRLSAQFTNANEFKDNLVNIFRAQSILALGKIGEPTLIETATGGLTRCYPLSNGNVRVITGSMGDGMVIGYSPSSGKVTILEEGRQYGVQPAPINPTDLNTINTTLQITDVTLSPDTILLGFTDGVSGIFDTKMTSVQPNNRAAPYISIKPTDQSVRSIFQSLFQQHPNADAQTIQNFFLDLVVAHAERARESVSEENMGKIRNWIQKFIESQNISSKNIIDNDFLKNIGDKTIESFLKSSKNKQKKELVLLALDSLEFSRESYVRPNSLGDLWKATFAPHAGDDASLVVFKLDSLKYNLSEQFRKSCLTGNWAAINYLITKNPNPELIKKLILAEDSDGNNALHYAAQSWNLNTINLLLVFFNKEELDAMSNNIGQHPLHLAFKQSGPIAVQIMSSFFNRGLNITLKTTEGKTENNQKTPATKRTFLHTAIFHNHAEAVSFLLTTISKESEEIRFNFLNATDIIGDTALHIAVSKGNLKIVQSLLEQENIVNNPAQSEYKSDGCYSPYVKAVEFGFVDIAVAFRQNYEITEDEKIAITFLQNERNGARKDDILSTLQKIEEKVNELSAPRQLGVFPGPNFSQRSENIIIESPVFQ